MHVVKSQSNLYLLFHQRRSRTSAPGLQRVGTTKPWGRAPRAAINLPFTGDHTPVWSERCLFCRPPDQRWAPAAHWSLRVSRAGSWVFRLCCTHKSSRPPLSRTSRTVRSCPHRRTCLTRTRQVSTHRCGYLKELHAVVFLVFFAPYTQSNRFLSTPSLTKPPSTLHKTPSDIWLLFKCESL